MNSPFDHEMDMVTEAARFALVAFSTVLLLLSGAPTAIVGILVLILSHIVWPVLTGIGLVLSGLVCGWFGYRRLLRIKKHLEAPRRRNKVFISYRTAEHFREAERIEQVLHEAGITVFLAKAGDLRLDPANQFSIFRILGLFQLGQLDHELQGHLIESDAVVYLVPTTKSKPRFWSMAKDTLDAIFSIILFQSGCTLTSWRFMWYVTVYNRGILPAARLFDIQGWQEWELAVARQLSLPVLKVLLGKERTETAEDKVITCKSETLEDDLQAMVVPKIAAISRADPEISGPLPMMIFVVAGLYLEAGIAILSVIGSLAFLLAHYLL